MKMKEQSFNMFFRISPKYLTTSWEDNILNMHNKNLETNSFSIVHFIPRDDKLLKCINILEK